MEMWEKNTIWIHHNVYAACISRVILINVFSIASNIIVLSETACDCKNTSNNNIGFVHRR